MPCSLLTSSTAICMPVRPAPVGCPHCALTTAAHNVDEEITSVFISRPCSLHNSRASSRPGSPSWRKHKHSAVRSAWRRHIHLLITLRLMNTSQLPSLRNHLETSPTVYFKQHLPVSPPSSNTFMSHCITCQTQAPCKCRKINKNKTKR